MIQEQQSSSIRDSRLARKLVIKRQRPGRLSRRQQSISLEGESTGRVGMREEYRGVNAYFTISL